MKHESCQVIIYAACLVKKRIITKTKTGTKTKERGQEYQRKNRAKISEYQRRRRHEDPRSMMLCEAKVRAKKHGLLCAIIRSDIKIPV